MGAVISELARRSPRPVVDRCGRWTPGIRCLRMRRPSPLKMSPAPSRKTCDSTARCQCADRVGLAKPPSKGWATTPVTEICFVRISSNRRLTQVSTGVAQLEALSSLPGHEFWPDDVPLVVGVDGDRGVVSTHGLVADRHLIALATRYGGRADHLRCRTRRFGIGRSDRDAVAQLRCLSCQACESPGAAAVGHFQAHGFRPRAQVGTTGLGCGRSRLENLCCVLRRNSGRCVSTRSAPAGKLICNSASPSATAAGRA
ncbi:Ribonuclease VapC39 [Mycobacterium kansasii]|uniref:Ribonuclease VapC39 n=1 Tax=Mycobacterium kansasii TaxID=1768 RepID=A0A653EPA0_MYCKA|nr:hypothetical protein MKANGN_11160 [Mycobacterium kansasii]VAZ60164.1 Ribonuclease VapC39 [Mycobacterium kansasii]VAZ66519.1 Ribonuclease VapC39 [Mycobacterium kansasii]VAZ74883.1 Ribonuclease VapC39 [Mycobacterium kansasii]VTO98471.1 Ribonuclease VapC39 [Mycobacterium kansasii]